MERHEILDALTELKLYGMRASFDEIAGKGLNRRDEIFPFLASLIRADQSVSVGWLALRLGVGAATASLVAHVAYGVTLGFVYGRHRDRDR